MRAWKYGKALFSDWLNGMGTIFTFLGIIAYIVPPNGVEKKLDFTVPREAFLLIAFCSFVFVSYRLWAANEAYASAFKESVRDRCNAVILGWEKLNEDYHNAPKTEGQPQTLPNPMNHSWVAYGHKDWLYRVGFFQACTNTLLGDLRRAGIKQLDLSEEISMAELLNALRKIQRENPLLSN